MADRVQRQITASGPASRSLKYHQKQTQHFLQPYIFIFSLFIYNYAQAKTKRRQNRIATTQNIPVWQFILIHCRKNGR